MGKILDRFYCITNELKDMAHRIQIIFDIKDTATGGGNQFLRALKVGLQQLNRYAEQAAQADMFLFNSYQYVEDVLQVKKRFPGKPIIHRIDGPIRLYNTPHDIRDTIVYTANRFLADATIFQSEWSRSENLRLGLRAMAHETVIPNAPDLTLFNCKGRIGFSSDRKIKLIASSWSANWKKGFEVYRWLDEHLDFSRYEMTFVGNSPVHFKRIRSVQPLLSRELALELKNHDIYITASQKDPCSNSLVEALSCGLPALAYRDGGHPVIVGEGGYTFSQPDQIPDLLERLVSQYEDVQGRIRVPDIEEIVNRYCCFCDEVLTSIRSGTNQPREFTPYSELRMRSILSWLQFKHRMTNKVRRLYGHR